MHLKWNLVGTEALKMDVSENPCISDEFQCVPRQIVIYDLFATFVQLSGVISSLWVSNIIAFTVEQMIHVWCISYGFQWVPMHVRWMLMCTEAFDMHFRPYPCIWDEYSGCPGIWDGFHWVPRQLRRTVLGTEAIDMVFGGYQGIWDGF